MTNIPLKQACRSWTHVTHAHYNSESVAFMRFHCLRLQPAECEINLFQRLQRIVAPGWSANPLYWHVGEVAACDRQYPKKVRLWQDQSIISTSLSGRKQKVVVMQPTENKKRALTMLRLQGLRFSFPRNEVAKQGSNYLLSYFRILSFVKTRNKLKNRFWARQRKNRVLQCNNI